jgi:hypothetical protein
MRKPVFLGVQGSLCTQQFLECFNEFLEEKKTKERI